MKDIIIQFLNRTVLNVVSQICKAVEAVFGYLSRSQEIKIAKERETVETECEKRVEDACDNGDLESLLDAATELGKARSKSKKLVKNSVWAFILCSLMFASGCVSVEVATTKPWEGRYDTVEAAQTALDTVQLKHNESIWILNNSTLKRLLTSTKEN